jgi:hypothetical protein
MTPIRFHLDPSLGVRKQEQRFDGEGRALLQPALRTGRNAKALARIVVPILVLTVSCATVGKKPAQAPPEGQPGALRWQLPPSLEGQRGDYEHDVSGALEEVARFFRASGFEVASGDLIDSVIVFSDPAAAREHFAKTLGTSPGRIPATFAGTVHKRTLFLVSRESYKEIWERTYPDWPWTGGTYHGLVVHELAHRAHESIAISRMGSADAMGPSWFFEGLAVDCAGQFDKEEPPLSREEIETLVGGKATPPVSYPLYGRLVRSLSATIAMKDLITKAPEAGFPGILFADSSVK